VEDHRGMKDQRKAELRRMIEDAARRRRQDDLEDEDEDEGEDEDEVETEVGWTDDGEAAEPEVKKPPIPRPAGAPYWLPDGPWWEQLSDGVRQAVRDILEPAYRRLVVEAQDELERSAGITLVHLMWLEICDQTRLGNIAGDRKSICAIVEDPEESIARHLHLVGAKNSTAELLLKLRMTRAMLERGERSLGPPGAGLALPVPAAAGPTRAPQDAGCRIVGPDLTSPPEVCCGQEGPEIGKS
jgi:hypothetical protein